MFAEGDHLADNLICLDELGYVGCFRHCFSIGVHLLHNLAWLLVVDIAELNDSAGLALDLHLDNISFELEVTLFAVCSNEKDKVSKSELHHLYEVLLADFWMLADELLHGRVLIKASRDSESSSHDSFWFQIVGHSDDFLAEILDLLRLGLGLGLVMDGEG